MMTGHLLGRSAEHARIETSRQQLKFIGIFSKVSTKLSLVFDRRRESALCLRDALNHCQNCREIRRATLQIGNDGGVAQSNNRANAG